jgi:spore germination cell wall hydrolase CwlJ-like protein
MILIAFAMAIVFSAWMIDDCLDILGAAQPDSMTVKKISRTELESLNEEMYYDSLELLAICVQAEAGNQSLAGRRMVADVILNRVDSDDFPDTIEGVITQPDAFTSYWDGGMDNVYEPDETTFKAVQMELEQRSYPGILYFRTGRYSSYGTPYIKVGAHYFSTE